MTAKVAQVVVPSNPADQKKILEAVKEANDSLIRIDSEREQIKAIIESINEDFPDLNKKYIRKMIKTYHKGNLDNQVAEMDEFTTLYETIVG